MSQQSAVTEAVRRSVTVAVSRERAFAVFTDEFGSWWPKDYSIGAVEMADIIVEPRTGGRWYEVGVDGTECEIGRVTAYEPPERLVVAWHLDGTWQFDPDPAHASEFEVRFTADGEDRTRVELEHRLFGRHGDGAASVRESVDGPGGWDFCLAAYAGVFTA